MSPESFKPDFRSEESHESSQLGFALAEKFREATDSSDQDLELFRKLTSQISELPDDPKRALIVLRGVLRKNKFEYREDRTTLHEVLEKKSGNCLSLTVLISALLQSHERETQCKILIHPKDAVHEADVKLFDDLMRGEYFSYDNPQLPDFSSQPEINLRVNRFVPLSHPLLTLGGVPLETTMLADKRGDPFIEFPSEASYSYTPEQMISYVYSDRAKILAQHLPKARDDERAKLTSELQTLIEKSLAIDPANRDALQLRWYSGVITSEDDLKHDSIDRLKSIGADDSQYNYKLWTMTGDETYLNKSLDQFPQNMYAFLDKKVHLEKDDREARFNLAVALWCIYYSGSLHFSDFSSDLALKKRIKLLYPNTDLNRLRSRK